MMITGMENGEMIRIVLTPKRYNKLLDILQNEYDRHIREGIYHFLHVRVDDSDCGSDGELIPVHTDSIKPIFFEKLLDKKTRKSDIAYTDIIRKIVKDITFSYKEEFGNHDDYEIRTPCTLSGTYMMDNFELVND